jgi:hypothetical protein
VTAKAGKSRPTLHPYGMSPNSSDSTLTASEAIQWLIALIALCCDPLAIALAAAASKLITRFKSFWLAGDKNDNVAM